MLIFLRFFRAGFFLRLIFEYFCGWDFFANPREAVISAWFSSPYMVIYAQPQPQPHTHSHHHVDIQILCVCAYDSYPVVRGCASNARTLIKQKKNDRYNNTNQKETHSDLKGKNICFVWCLFINNNIVKFIACCEQILTGTDWLSVLISHICSKFFWPFANVFGFWWPFIETFSSVCIALTGRCTAKRTHTHTHNDKKKQSAWLWFLLVIAFVLTCFWFSVIFSHIYAHMANTHRLSSTTNIPSAATAPVQFHQRNG